MNEKLNLVEILKDCPEGTKLYSPIFGDVELVKVHNCDYPIEVKLSNNTFDSFTKDGRIYIDYDGECMLCPSREERNWDKLKPKQDKQSKFDPKTLKPFDKVLGRYGKDEPWCCDPWYCDLFSHIGKDVHLPYLCLFSSYKYCIPYNDDTKHLVGTEEEAPEFYRYWEE